ncbi:hypothetical protein GmHk_04G010026 [Glycine max]|nr:hypothetical protein GmHk_04G010026 [Glycine max]
MQRHVFLQVVEALNNHDKNDLSSLQKCITALRILANGSLADSVDEDEYLRRPNDKDTRRLVQMGAACDFSCIRGITKLVDLECIFGTLGSNNNISVLNASNVFDEVLSRCAPVYDMGYYLADDIYPKFATFVKPSQCHKDNRENYLQNDKNQQERM